MLVQVTAPHFCAGLVLDETGTVVEAAPILGWTVGKHWRELRPYFAKRRWTARRVTERSRDPP
jgi:hypothetical protein